MMEEVALWVEGGFGVAFGETFLRDAGVTDRDVEGADDAALDGDPSGREALGVALAQQVECASDVQIALYVVEREAMLCLSVSDLRAAASSSPASRRAPSSACEWEQSECDACTAGRPQDCRRM